MSEAAASNDPALRWGLPAGFRPVVAPLPDDVKELMRGVLRAGEPVVAALGNEGDSIFVIATPQRLFRLKRGAAAGVTGWNLQDYEWLAITDLRLKTASINVGITVSFHSRDGRTPESGPRARQWKLCTDTLTPFETARGSQLFEAIQSIWVHKTHSEN